VTVDAGCVGVYDLFGDVSDDELNPGLHFKNPFAHIEIMSVKTLEIKETSEVPSKEGLIVRLETSILYKIKPNEASDIYQKLGSYYSNVVIIPNLRSTIREITSQFEAKALYTSARQNITQEIYNSLLPILDERGIILKNVLLRDLGIPATVTTAIEQKLKAEQESEQMKFILEKETQEAERKRIEARGIADSQNIIDESLTSEYLQWYWISHLADHNSVIYVPIGENGMPLFKDVSLQ